MEEILKELEKHRGAKGKELSLPISRASVSQYNAAVKKMFEDRGVSFQVWRDNVITFDISK